MDNTYKTPPPDEVVDPFDTVPTITQTKIDEANKLDGGEDELV